MKNQRISESANQRISESANQRISESANQRISESANQRISESANQRISESANQRIIVYLDYATIPSLNYILHFAENYQDKESIRLFGLARFTIPDIILEEFPENVLSFCKIDYDYYIQAKDKLFYILKEVVNTKKVEIEFHLNLSSSVEMMKEMYEAYKHYLPYIEDIRLHLYDDGTKDILNLYRISQYSSEELREKIYKSHFQMSHLFVNNSVFDKTISCYLWNNIYYTKYYFILTYFIENPNLTLLKDNIKNYEVMALSRFSLLNKKQRNIVLDILGVDLISLKKIFPKEKYFLFTATTIFGFSQESVKTLISIHKYMIDKYRSDLGKEYELVIKGHPSGQVVNDGLSELYPDALFIPPNIPLEILFMLGLIPDKVGGFASTSYLNLMNLDIHSIAFITHNDINKEDYFRDQYLLMEVMRKLNIISEDKCAVILLG